jgi:hypothetical protein
VIAHERYEDLLKKAGVLNQEFVSYQTRLTFQQDADGKLVPVVETHEVGADITLSDDGTAPDAGDITSATTGAGAGTEADGGRAQTDPARGRLAGSGTRMSASRHAAQPSARRSSHSICSAGCGMALGSSRAAHTV